MFLWDSENEAYLRTEWVNGVSTSDIAASLGTTRNSVIGKAHRLNLPIHKRTQQKTKNGATRLRIRAATPLHQTLRKKEIRVMAPPVEPSSDPKDWVHFWAIGPDNCRAILGNSTDDGLALYCNNKAAGVYCPYHNSKFYNPDYRR